MDGFCDFCGQYTPNLITWEVIDKKACSGCREKARKESVKQIIEK